ncbi:MAG: AAA family ATPase [Promethearchaeota archaeon]
MSSAQYLMRLAEEKASKASEYDRAGKRSEAASIYIEAADILAKAARISRMPKMRLIALERAEQYIARAKLLRSGRVRIGGPGPDIGDTESEGPDSELQDDIASLVIREKPSVKWEDVANLEEAKQALREAIILPILRPDLFTGARHPWKGVLLFGPPGCGKTLIAKAVANETDATFFNADAGSLVSKWLGESERLVKQLFTSARKSQPSIVFLDEVDALTAERGSDQVGGERRLKTQFLVEIDGMKSRKDDRVIVLGATNRPWDIDPAFRRRFERRIYVPTPEKDARVRIFEIHTRGIDLDSDVDFDHLGDLTDGFAGSDIAHICREAALEPIRELDVSGDIRDKEKPVRPVRQKDFVDSLSHIHTTITPEEMQRYKEWEEKHGT